MSSSYFSLIEWPGPLLRLYEFIGVFLALGAIGFRYSSLRGRLEGQDTVYHRMARRAAGIGFAGAILYLIHVIQVLPRLAKRAKLPVADFLTTPSVNAALFYLIILAVIGFLIALLGRKAGWTIAAVALLAALLRNVVLLEWQRIVTPFHIVTGGLWIGTLFVLVVAGMGAVMSSEADRGARGRIVADLVNDFSPMALTCGILVVAIGVVAAFRELEPFSALWTTPYGYTLIAKVCVVGVVLALGAWNWRKQRPTLGTDEGALSIRRSATLELAAATVVLILTSVMLSLPTK